jgi:REP element-mobilizing transposase RayT
MIFDRFDPPLYFVTFCTFDRRPVLATADFHARFVEYLTQKSREGIACGEYAIMPDHVHLFLRVDPSRYVLGKTIGFLKQALSKPLKTAKEPMPHWQPGFFDHILRSADSYSAKWEYVRENPVRAGLVERAEDWPYWGTIVPIQY